MGGKLTRSAYEGMIEENLKWLEEQPNTLENIHIQMIVKRSVGHEYLKHDVVPDENHPRFEGFIRAFWRRIEPHKSDFAKELPKELPIEFRAHMATALTYFRK